MSWPSYKPWTPTAEELAAFANGALDGCAGTFLRRRIETWMADHPEQAAEVDLQRRLARLMQSTIAPEPGPSAWAALWTRINQTPSPAPAPPGGPRGRRFLWSAAVLLLAAAAAWLFLVWAPWQRAVSDHPEEVVEPFPVATDDEIEIVRMDAADSGLLAVGRPPVAGPLDVADAREVEIVRVNGADTRALVVGELPVRGPLMLAGPGEVTLKSIDPGPGNQATEVHMGHQDTPMIWARMETDGEK
jgi:hypothetical protein